MDKCITTGSPFKQKSLDLSFSRLEDGTKHVFKEDFGQFIFELL